jgi:hypothetical protein
MELKLFITAFQDEDPLLIYRWNENWFDRPLDYSLDGSFGCKNA